MRGGRDIGRVAGASSPGSVPVAESACVGGRRRGRSGQSSPTSIDSDAGVMNRAESPRNGMRVPGRAQ